MLLGKRPRPPIKRTTSMSGITLDPTVLEPQEPSDHQHAIEDHAVAAGPEGPVAQNMNVVSNGGHDQRFLAMVSPRSTQRRNSGDHFMNAASFLQTCGLCKRLLAPGRDIYMYRGDIAFCSLECREHQMKQDERKEKFSVASKKEGPHESPTTAASTKASSKSETVAAA